MRDWIYYDREEWGFPWVLLIVAALILVFLFTNCSDPVGPPDTDEVVCVDWPTGGWICCNDATQSCTRYWEE